MVSIERRDLMKTLVAAAVASTLRSAQAAEPPVFGGIMRKGRPPGDSPSKPPAPVHSVERADGLLIERNAAVKLRDGVTIYADVYRPDSPLSEEKLPAIVGWGPYGKHTVGRTYSPESGVKPGWISKYTGFEGNDPLYWCPRGYAIVYPDPRGLWWSEGDMHHGGIIESHDCYDLIEWVGTRDWCSGKVGLSGVSYLAAIQYQVAPLRPPHLAAINPWEGFHDWYREFAYHGGIRETGFLPYAANSITWGQNLSEDTDANVKAHPLYDDYWRSKETRLEDIEVPAFVVASWTDQGFHTRGTLDCFRKISSKHKWLLVHGQKKWGHFFDPRHVRQLQTFFDHFLKGVDDAVLDWPKVQIEVRERAYVQVLREEVEWPLQRQQLVPLYLNAAGESAERAMPGSESQRRYLSTDADQSAHFDHVFAQDTEITGHMKLKLWVAAADADDMDLFIAIQKIDRNQELVGFHYYASFDTGPAALGWLRVSHRELDPRRSKPEQPVQSHLREQMLGPGQIVPVEIEIWPSSTSFAKGEKLRVLVKGSDIYPYPSRTVGTPLALHGELRNRGDHVIWTGGRYDSHLLVPVIPGSAAAAALRV